MTRFKNLIFAGTFDHLHIGHKKMLEKAFKIADHVSIFITTKKLYQTKLLANLIPIWQVRKGAVEQYLRKEKLIKRSSFFKLENIYGSSVEASGYDSILVTQATKKNALLINIQRKKQGLQQLNIIVAAYVRGDDGEVVTSERIRKGEIDRKGTSCRLSVIDGRQKILKLPENLRDELRKPLGKVVSGSVDQLTDTAKKIVKSIKSLKSKVSLVISVGDIVTISLLKVGYVPDVSILDLKSRREEISNDKFQISNQFQNPKHQIFKTENIPGTINIKTASVIKKSFENFFRTRNKQVIIVKGEEDLLALPAILFAPLGSIVLYGQWNLGVVMVNVTEEKKERVRDLLGKFD